MKDKLNKKNIKKTFLNILPFLLFTIYIIIIHFNMLSTYGDDIWFANFKNQNLLKIMQNRYETWTSRFILDTFLFVFNGHLSKLWIFINIGCCYLVYYSIFRMLKLEKASYEHYFLILLIFLYPFIDMGSSGWITTTIVYIWPLALGIYSFLTLIRYIRRENIKKITIILSVISAIIAVNQEQVCLLFFGFLFLFILNDYMKTKKINKLSLIYSVITIIMLINHLLCPGNSARVAISVATSFPDYNKLSIFGKFGLALNNTYEMLLGQLNYIFIFLLIIIIYNLVKKKASKIYIILSILLLIGSLILPFLHIFNMSKLYANYLCPSGKNCIPVLPIINYGSKRYMASIMVSIFYLTSTMLLLFKCFQNKKDNYKYIIPIIFLAGIMSRLAVGFSPTLYISGYRTGIFMYFLMIIVCMFLVKNIKLNQNNYIDIIILLIILFTLTHFISLVPDIRM